MSENDTDTAQSAMPANDIYKTRRWVRRVRSTYYDELANHGQCRQSTHRTLQSAVLAYWDTLREYRDDVEDLWEDHDLDKIPRLADEHVEVQVRKPGYGPSTRSIQKPAISQLEASTLVDLTQRLDTIAHKLGFAADAKKQTEQTEITEEMIEGVEKWRQANLE